MRKLEDCTTNQSRRLGLTCKFSLASQASGPVVVLVHGRGGNAGVMGLFANLCPDSAHIISLQGWISDPITQSNGWSWWTVTEHAGLGPEILQSVLQVHQAIVEFIKLQKLKPKLILGIGFSQGAALLSGLIQKFPDVLSAAVFLSGFVLKFNDLGASEAPQLSQRILQTHGTSDQIIPLSKAQEAESYLSSLGCRTELVVDPVGHKVGTQGMLKLKSWLCSF